jgi:serine/threonine protein kinase
MDKITKLKKNMFSSKKLKSLNIEPDLINLIREILQKHPKQRPKFQDILNHKVFKMLEIHNEAASPEVHDFGFKERLESVKKEVQLSEIEKEILK